MFSTAKEFQVYTPVLPLIAIRRTRLRAARRFIISLIAIHTLLRLVKNLGVELEQSKGQVQPIGFQCEVFFFLNQFKNVRPLRRLW